MKNILWIALAAVLVVGAGVGGYFIGVDKGESQSTSIRESFLAERGVQGTVVPGGNRQGFAGRMSDGTIVPGGDGQVFAGRMGVGGMGTIGTIKEIDGNVLIVSAGDSEVRVEIVDDTRITMYTEGDVADLNEGDQIMVTGESEGDTMTAAQIQVMSGFLQ